MNMLIWVWQSTIALCHSPQFPPLRVRLLNVGFRELYAMRFSAHRPLSAATYDGDQNNAYATTHFSLCWIGCTAFQTPILSCTTWYSFWSANQRLRKQSVSQVYCTKKKLLSLKNDYPPDATTRTFPIPLDDRTISPWFESSESTLIFIRLFLSTLVAYKCILPRPKAHHLLST